jgi:hypothetical protein
MKLAPNPMTTSAADDQDDLKERVRMRSHPREDMTAVETLHFDETTVARFWRESVYRKWLGHLVTDFNVKKIERHSSLGKRRALVQTSTVYRLTQSFYSATAVDQAIWQTVRGHV